ncbi:hypothetical protein NQZ79_g3137 [Umbelopsis isabellina]|nr:hypothetical protein NQZ79_g3137 [Umbelopsis isabellina]
MGEFEDSSPNITRLWVVKPKSSSHAISEACVTLATNYSSNIIENSEGRVTSYLRFKTSKIFPYSFPRIAGMPENWPEDVDCTVPVVATVDHLCSELKEQISTPVTAETLSASPGTFVPVLKFILREPEKPYEVARTNK